MTATTSALWRVTGAQRILTLGSLLGATAFFAAMPFGALYLDEYTGLTTLGVGLVVGGMSLVGAVGGFLGGRAVDRFGPVRCIQAGLAVTVAAYVLLATVRTSAVIIALFLLLGVARALVEPASKTLMSNFSDEEGRVFRLRYMTLCAGAIAGPLAGGLLYHYSPVAFFAVPAALYAWFLLVITRHAAVLRGAATTVATGPRYPVRAALADRRLVAAIVAGLVIFFVFSQLESMVPLIMRGHFGGSTETLFSFLFVTNAVLALALQPVIDRVTPRLGHTRIVLVGAAGFALAFGCFAAMGTGVGWLFAGIVFWTVGEGTLLPLPDIAVHTIADQQRKGTYFGLSELRYLGFFAGPAIGGAVLGLSTGWYFAVFAVAIVTAVPFLLARPESLADVEIPAAEDELTPAAALITEGAAHAA